MSDILHKIINDNWSYIGEGRAPSQLSFIMFNKVLLVFKDNASDPFVVLKISRNSNLEREYVNLKKIHSLLPDITPAPLFFYSVDQLHVVGLSYVEGVDLANMPLTPQLLRSCFTVLKTFHHSVMKGTFRFDAENREKMIQSQLEIFKRINPEVVAIDGYQEHVEQVSFPESTTFFMIPQHSDFSLVNLKYNSESEQLFIIDWADFGKTCLPLYDVFLLLVSKYLGRVTCEKLIAPGEIEKTFMQCFSAYLEEFEINDGNARNLFAIFLITFFNQNYLAGRKTTADNIYDFFICYLRNHESISWTT